MTRFLAAALWLLSLATSLGAAPSQAAEVEHEFEAWHLALAQGRIAGDALYWLELQPRMDLNDPGRGRALLRPAAGYALGPLSLWLGYAWIPSWDLDAGSLEAGENRVFQQLLYNERVGPVRVQSRTRFEQRLLPQSAELAHRFRTLARMSVALAPGSGLSLVGWDEVFFHLNDVEGGPTQGFDQNRAFAGVSWRVSPTFTFELGYANVFLRRTQAPHGMSHVLYSFTVWSFL